MGNCYKIQTSKEQNENSNVREEWRYNGNIYEKRVNKFSNEYQLIRIDSLNGKIYILEGIKNREIKIKLKEKKTEFIGDEIEKPKNLKNEEKFVFKMRSDNELDLNKIEIIRYSNGNTKLKGNDIYIKDRYRNKRGPFLLDLILTNHKEYSNFCNYGKINPSNIELSKLINPKDEEDILINSLCGMENLINTCYINSSFQILIHIPQFIKIIRKNKEFQNNIIEEINNIFDQILDQFKKYKKIINPKSFVNYFKSNHYAFNNYSQMDSEMFLEELLWDINIQLGDLGEKRIKDLFPNPKSIKEINFLNYIIESEKETNFEINDLFYVYFIHEKKCKQCNHKTHYFDETPGLKLNFEQTKYKSQIDLISLIMDNFKHPIEIKSRIICENCRACFNIIETTRIAKLPKILILTLQKSNTENTQKIPWIVNFAKKIGIREIVDIDLIKNDSAKYEIFAINNHSGSTPKSGHYYSQIYLEKLGAWYSFNDEYVSSESYWKNPNLDNYILFYKQIDK